MIKQRVLRLMETDILRCGGRSLTTFGISLQNADEILQESSDLIRIELADIDQLSERSNADQRISQLNTEQRSVFDLIEAMCSGNTASNILFLGASPGTGKSFLLNTVISHHRSQNHIVLATASTANASLLLYKGRTVHSQFKVPLNIHTDSMCNISRGTNLASLINQTSIIIIDEVTMLNKMVIESIDRSLQDIRNIPNPFGGIPVIMAGDYKQCLPIVPGQGRDGISSSVLTRSYLWPFTTICTLKISMRLRPGLEQWHQYLEDIGNGKLNNALDDVELQHVNITSNINDLISHVFPDLYSTSLNSVILCPLNSSVTAINNMIIDEVPGESRTYLSIDSSLTEEGQSNYPVEFLNTLDIGCLPPHKLKLKIGTPIIVLRNIKHPTMVNGTR